jgi:transcriptional regulator with XRE-family HTH domain
VNKVLKRLKEFKDEESRYAYADAVTNAFLTGQIKALRDERGLTQEQLAELVGTQQSGISRWLNSGFSTCKVGSLRKFARAYGVRLRITFEPFGTLPTDVGGFTKERLAPPPFEKDPAFQEHTAEEEEGNTAAARIARNMLKEQLEKQIEDRKKQLQLLFDSLRPVPQPKPVEAITPANETNSDDQGMRSVGLSVDIEFEKERAAA